jgi:hypothetical protein
MDVPVGEEKDEVNGSPAEGFMRSETVPQIGKVGFGEESRGMGKDEVKKWEKEKQIG